jgi:TonB family protein
MTHWPAFGAIALACTFLTSADRAASQSAPAGETCGVVVKAVNGCEGQLQVKGADTSFRIQIPRSARAAFPAVLATYESATVCVTSTPSKPGKSFTFKATTPDSVRIASAPPELSVAGVYEPRAQGMTPPKLISQTPPKYTRDAMNAKIAGDVELTGVVLTNGTVTALRVVKPLDPCGGLDDEAIKAGSQWEFVPAQFEGHAVPAKVTLILSFRLH